MNFQNQMGTTFLHVLKGQGKGKIFVNNLLIVHLQNKEHGN